MINHLNLNMEPAVGNFKTEDLDFVNFLLTNGALDNSSFVYSTDKIDEKPVSYSGQKPTYETSTTQAPNYVTSSTDSIDNFVSDDIFDDPFGNYKAQANMIPKDLESIDEKVPDTAFEKTYNIAFKVDDNYQSDTGYDNFGNDTTTLTTKLDKLKLAQNISGATKLLDPYKLKIAKFIDSTNSTNSSLYFKSSKENEENGYETNLITNAQFENKKNEEANKNTLFTNPMKELNDNNNYTGLNGIQSTYDYLDDKKENNLPQPINTKILTAVPIGNCGVIMYK